MYQTLIPQILLRDIINRRITADPFSWGPHLTYFSLGRIALLYGVRLLDREGEGRKEILVPAYLCEETLWPLRQSGFNIKYYSVDDKWEPDFNELQKQLDKNTLAVLAVQYFGIPQKFEGVREICQEQGIFLIEDCAHAFFGYDGDIPIGSLGDLSIFSLRKFLPIPDGGVLAVNNTSLKESIAGIGVVPNRRRVAWSKLIIRSALYHLKDKYDLRARSMMKASSIDELCPRANLVKEKTAFVENEGISDLSRELFLRFDLEEMVSRRRANYNELATNLADIEGINIPHPKVGEGWSPYVLPIYVEERQQFKVLKSLINNGIMATDWPTLPPGLKGEMRKRAIILQRRIILLPIHQHIGRRAIDVISQTIKGSLK